MAENEDIIKQQERVDLAQATLGEHTARNLVVRRKLTEDLAREQAALVLLQNK